MARVLANGARLRFRSGSRRLAKPGAYVLAVATVCGAVLRLQETGSAQALHEPGRVLPVTTRTIAFVPQALPPAAFADWAEQ